MTQRRSVKRGYKNGGIGGGLERRAVWWFVGRGLSCVSATAALWAAAAARWSEKRPITSALGECSLVLSVT